MQLPFFMASTLLFNQVNAQQPPSSPEKEKKRGLETDHSNNQAKKPKLEDNYKQDAEQQTDTDANKQGASAEESMDASLNYDPYATVRSNALFRGYNSSTNQSEIDRKQDAAQEQTEAGANGQEAGASKQGAVGDDSPSHTLCFKCPGYKENWEDIIYCAAHCPDCIKAEDDIIYCEAHCPDCIKPEDGNHCELHNQSDHATYAE